MESRGETGSRTVRFAVLGPLEVQGPHGPIDVSPGKQRSILALLALDANQVISRDRLVDELWGDAPPPNAVKALQVHVAQLRRSLAGAIGDEAARSLLATRSPGYVIQLEADDLDLTRFEAALGEARRALDAGDTAQAHARATEALALWRGPPLADLELERTLHEEVSRIEELRVSAQELAVEAALRLGRHDAALPELEALVKEHPLRERLRGQLMLCLYRSGRQAEALEAYQATRRALVEELGIEPGRQLRELQQAILRQEPRLELAAAVSPVGETRRGAFVGRGPELAELVGGLDDALAGRGRLFLLAGEPGIGKSRLAEELIAHARARGAQVLIGRCWEAGGAPAYWPWVQSLRTYVRESDPVELHAQLGDRAAEVAQLIPDVRRLVPDLPELPSLEADGARFRLFDATAEFLRAASASRPLVILLDDLHAADASSLLLLQFLARELGLTRVLVVGAYRDVDPVPSASLAAALAAIAREPTTRRLALHGLSATELAEYVERTAGDAASADLVASLHEETDGNPLFAGEIVRLLVAEGVQPGSSNGVRIAIPESVKEVIARRLAHLSREAGRVLVLGSVLGREFELDALAGLVELAEDDLLDVLDEAVSARVVTDVPAAPGRLRFAHVLIRDTLYEGLTGMRRARLHRRALEVLEGLHGEDSGSEVSRLVHHAIAGRDFEKALRHAWRAGDGALRQLAYEEAARLYRTAMDALDAADRPDEAARCRLLLSLGEAEDCAGERAAARTAFLAAAQGARSLGLRRELALAAIGYGGRLVWGRAGYDDQLVPVLQEGLAAAGDEHPVLRVRLLARLAGALRDDPARERRDALSREAVELGRRTGDLAALAYALNGRAAAIMAPDTGEEVLALGTELSELGERIGDRERVAQACTHRSFGLLQAGEVRVAEADLELGMRLAGQLGQPALIFLVGGAQAMLALAEGHFTRANEIQREAFRHGERVHRRATRTVQTMQRYALYDFEGRLAELAADVEQVVADEPARPVFRCVLAHLQARLAPTPDALRTLDDLAAAEVAALPFDQEWLFGASLLAETAALLRSVEAAEVLYRALSPWAALNVVDQGEGIRGSVARYLGLLASTLERWDEADRHFTEAARRNADMGLRPWLALTQDDHATTLQARALPRDRHRAEALRDAALATYLELGMSPRATYAGPAA